MNNTVLGNFNYNEKADGVMVDQLITQIANTMDVSEAEVREALDNLINASQPYEPIKSLCKSKRYFDSNYIRKVGKE